MFHVVTSVLFRKPGLFAAFAGLSGRLESRVAVYSSAVCSCRFQSWHAVGQSRQPVRSKRGPMAVIRKLSSMAVAPY